MDIEVKGYSCITYIPNQKEMYIRQSRIFLTNFEALFINYILDNSGYCNLESFTKYLSKVYGRKVQRKCIVVYIGRLRRKIYYQTGDKIIKSKYSFGNFINS